MFGEFDKVAKLNAFLHNPGFKIVVANLIEIFDMFLARFTSVIAPFDFIDYHKISKL